MKDKSLLDKPICPLWGGGSCPICDDDYCDLGISYTEAQLINQECCESHRQPTVEEIALFYSDISDKDKI